MTLLSILEHWPIGLTGAIIGWIAKHLHSRSTTPGYSPKTKEEAIMGLEDDFKSLVAAARAEVAGALDRELKALQANPAATLESLIQSGIDETKKLDQLADMLPPGNGLRKVLDGAASVAAYAEGLLGAVNAIYGTPTAPTVPATTVPATTVPAPAVPAIAPRVIQSGSAASEVLVPEGYILNKGPGPTYIRKP